MTTRRSFPRIVAALALPLAAAALILPALGCAGQRIALAESLGYEKREQLVDRVTEARDEQHAAKEQFASALDELRALTGPLGTELEAVYDRLRAELDGSEARADDVRERIERVERVADALFREWERELDDYQSAELRRASERQLRDTRAQYRELLGAMKRAEASMAPVLAALRDNVLFLKHNLNAQAIASLGVTFDRLETDIAALIRDMEASIAEADAFIGRMSPPDAD